MENSLLIFFICLIVGLFMGRCGVIGFCIDRGLMRYRNKYGKYTPGDGRNYLQIFHTSWRIE